jgi:hypothetical protein
MSYSVHKNLIIRYIENAKKEFNKEWLAGDYDGGACWDQRDYIARRLTDYNCYIEWKKNKGRPPKIARQESFCIFDIKELWFTTKDDLDNFRKIWGNGTTKVLISDDGDDAYHWLVDNIGPERISIDGAVIGYEWEIDTLNTEMSSNTDQLRNIEVFIKNPEKAFEFALRFGVYE